METALLRELAEGLGLAPVARRPLQVVEAVAPSKGYR
jgi:hypothetical protein